MENKKLSFFSRVKKAIFKFEDYEFFINEKIKVAIFYIFKLLILSSIIVSIAITYKVVSQLEDMYHNIFDSMPDFEFSEGVLNSSQTLEKVNEEHDFYLMVDTTEVNEKKEAEYKSKLEEHSLGIVLLRDKLIYRVNDSAEYLYSDILEIYGTSDVSFNKEQTIKYIKENASGVSLYSCVFLLMFISFFIITLISVISDIILLSLLGMITARLAKLKLNYASAIIIGIYSLTLPIILLTLYDVTSILTAFNIEFFNVIYISIGYIYVIAAILLMKSELIKQTVEIGKIVEVQEDVRKELENKEENPKDKEEKKENDGKEDNKKDDNEDTGIDVNDNEPDGSEI